MPDLSKALLIAAAEYDVNHVRESDGPNDSPRIRLYLAACGIKRPAPWCACFLSWALLEAGYLRGQLPPNPASACAWKQWAKLKGLLSEHPKEAKRGDLFVWCDPKTWQGHIGWIIEARSLAGVWFVRTLEGNSNEDGSREGTMVTRRGKPGVPFPIGWRRWTPRMRVIRLTEWTP